MSFRVDLWNGFDIIKNQFSSTINKISNLYNVLLSYVGCEKVYSKSLESLYKDNKDLFKDEDYLLDKNLIMLINNFKSESEFHKEHYKYVKHNILVSLKEITEKEKSLLNNLFNEGMQNQENFIKTKNNLITKQKNYNSALKNFYDFLSNFNEYELNILLENDIVHSYSINISDKMDNIKIANTMKDLSYINLNTTFSEDIKMNKKINKREKLIEKIRQSREEYTSLLNESNEFLESYKNKNENILQTLEGKYQSLISNIYSTLITTVDNRIDLINKINLLYSSYLEKNLKNITVKKEIMEFIIKNATKDFPLNKFEFISNNFENNNKLSSIHINSYLKEKLENEENFNRDSKRPKSQKKTEAKNFNGRPTKKKNTSGQNENASIVLENPLNNDIKNYKIKSNIYLIENFIEELIFDQKEEKTKDIELIPCSDSSGKMKEISNIKSLLDKKNDYHIDYIENFFKALNLKRAKGHFVLDKKSYDILIDLFNFLLNNQPNVDFILKNIIILSQTFYSLETNKDELNLSKKKIFLQNGLKNLPIFNNPETWHRVINFNLSSNINSKDISLQLDKNEINKKLNVLAYNLLMSYLTDIKDFTNDQNVFEEVKNFYIRIYNLNAETLNKQINDIILYEPEPKKKKGVSFTVKK